MKLLIVAAWLVTSPTISSTQFAPQTTLQCAPGRHPYPIVGCEYNGRRWLEGGTMCHANIFEQKPIVCLCVDDHGRASATKSTAANDGGTCSIPAGWPF